MAAQTLVNYMTLEFARAAGYAGANTSMSLQFMTTTDAIVGAALTLSSNPPHSNWSIAGGNPVTITINGQITATSNWGTVDSYLITIGGVGWRGPIRTTGGGAITTQVINNNWKCQLNSVAVTFSNAPV